MGITMAGVPSEPNSGICGTDGFIAATGRNRPRAATPTIIYANYREAILTKALVW